MSIEGLQEVLDKKEVVPTVSASDLLERPDQVEAGYLYHVRTYLPINRAGEGGEGQLSVEEFEKRLIKQVKEGKVPRGYITAGYGYGKTTTALYLWQRAQDANLVIVPPFTLSELPDLLTAVYGWLRHKLGGSRPTLIDQLDQLYIATVDRSLERIANERNLAMEQVQSLWRDGYLLLDLQAAHYISFFEAATEIAREAGFDGLIIIPDEIQQYFRPKQKESGDPIAPFFNIIQLLNTRATTADWHFGFIMVITLEELAQIRDTYRRTDLLHRMKDLQIDLTTLYDRQFAPNLWNLMAQRFDFVKEKSLIVDDETLLALGEITARTDISDGPRTAINVFRRMVSRYVDSDGRSKPYTPIDLITDFLDEQTIAFAGNDKIRNAVRRALSDDRVRDDFEHFAPAVKLAAAFPTNGVPLEIQRKYKQDQALAQLMQKAIGDIVRSGALEQGAITLIGLAPEKERISWLPATVREFRLGYNELARVTQERAEEAFIALLRERVFVSGKWKIVDQWERSFVANRSIIFEGTFDSFRVEFPRRRVHVRLLWENEPVKDAENQGDVCIEYQLRMYMDLPADERKAHSDPIEDMGNSTARIPLNFLYSDLAVVSPGIQKELEDVWSPYELSPLVLTNIYQLVEEKRNQGQIPKREEGRIRDGFLPEVLDTLMRSLFNEKVGEPIGAAGATITEAAIGYMLKARYSEYVPLITVQNWKSSLEKYDNALLRLELPGQRQGDIDVEGTKEQITKLFAGMSNTGLDSFIKTFPTLLQTVKEFRGNNPGIVRFTLHPLEVQIMTWLRASDRKDAIKKNGQTIEIRRLNVASVIREAGHLGYLDEEVEALIQLLQTRGLIDVKQDWLLEVPPATLNLDEVRQQLHDLERDLALLADGFESNQLDEWRQQVESKLRPRLNELIRDKSPNPNDVAKLTSTIRTRQNDVASFAHDQQRVLLERVRALQRTPDFPDQSLESLSKPFNSDVEYYDQVNALMASLRREGERVQREVAGRRTRLKEAADVLSRSSLGYDELARQARSIGQYSELADEINQLVESFSQRHMLFGGWRELVMQGAALERELSSEDPTEIKDIRAALDRLSIDIRGEISSQSNRLDALPLYEPFVTQLNEIRAALDTIKKQKRTAFLEFQQRYREALIESHIIDGSQWREITYNPLDPRGSHDQVVRQAQEAVLLAVRQLLSVATGGRQTLDTMRKSVQTLPLGQRESVSIETEALLPQFETTIDALRRLETPARELGTFYDIDKLFLPLIAQVADVADQCLKQNEEVTALRKLVGEIEPTQSEAQVLECLQAQQDHTEVDIVDLKTQFPASENEFWQALQGLYDKNYIRIHIQLKED